VPFDQLAQPVLVVEDDAGLRAYLSAILEEHGYRVIAAGSGEEALQALAGERAMLAVLDVGLPGMDGFAVAEHLAEDVPVIVVTGDPLRAKMRAFGRQKKLMILAKPITPDQFEAAVSGSL
jgi:CheY-like chemotaxis protein